MLVNKQITDQNYMLDLGFQVSLHVNDLLSNIYESYPNYDYSVFSLLHICSIKSVALGNRQEKVIYSAE